MEKKEQVDQQQQHSPTAAGPCCGAAARAGTAGAGAGAREFAVADAAIFGNPLFSLSLSLSSNPYTLELSESTHSSTSSTSSTS
jgi:hypothetical protein